MFIVALLQKLSSLLWIFGVLQLLILSKQAQRRLPLIKQFPTYQQILNSADCLLRHLQVGLLREGQQLHELGQGSLGVALNEHLEGGNAIC